MYIYSYLAAYNGAAASRSSGGVVEGRKMTTANRAVNALRALPHSIDPTVVVVSPEKRGVRLLTGCARPVSPRAGILCRARGRAAKI